MSVNAHLKSLKKLGLVEYSSVPKEQRGWARYIWVSEKNPEEVKVVHGRKTLTSKVARKLRELRTADRHQLAKELNYPYHSDVSKVLSGLVLQGVAKRVGLLSAEKQSDISLTDEGRKFRREYCKMVRNALQDGEDLEKMQELLYELKNPRNLSYFEKGIQLYEQVSPGLKRRDPTNRKFELLGFIRGFHKRTKEWPRQRDIPILLKNYLNPLVDEVLLTKTITGVAVRYAIVNEN